MIKNENFGIHKNVVIAEFGTGDIKMTKSHFEGDKFQTILAFHNQTPARKIGEVDSEWNGKTMDEVDRPEIVMIFKKPESITALIHSLCELQKEVFDYEKHQNNSAKVQG